MKYTRFAIFHSPPPGELFDRASSWLGWNPAKAEPRRHPDLPGLPVPVTELTETPRKYGFHGTLRAPFRLAEDMSLDELVQRVRNLAASLPKVELEGMVLTSEHGFLALRPIGSVEELRRVASMVVEQSNPWRAPHTADDLARRKVETLTPLQKELFHKWGYPFVMEEFHFHLTLSGKLIDPISAAVKEPLNEFIAPAVPQPYGISDLCIFAERLDGRFEIVDRFPLLG